MKNIYLKIVTICCILTTAALWNKVEGATAQAKPLSQQSSISLITCAPCNDDVYTLYGHTALRVRDAEKNIDLVFNYGIFDFSKPNFIYRFAKGETDYKLCFYNFNNFLIEYIDRGSEVYEQILNLSQSEKEAIWQALALNARPENRVYRYNFFFDNCATRPAAIIEKNIQEKISYDETTKNKTFRDEINYCTRNDKWQTFGCDLILGASTDRVMTFKETFFLPVNLKEAFNKAKISHNGELQPLVLQKNILTEDDPSLASKSSQTISPLTCTILFFIIFALLTIIELRKKKYYRLIDCVLFFIAGVAGCIMFFMSFISVHPFMFPNISLLWLHPFHLLGVIFFSVKKLKKAAFWYHFINFAAIFGMSVAWFLISQHFNIAFLPLIATLWMRSGWALIRKKLHIE